MRDAQDAADSQCPNAPHRNLDLSLSPASGVKALCRNLIPAPKAPLQDHRCKELVGNRLPDNELFRLAGAMAPHLTAGFVRCMSKGRKIFRAQARNGSHALHPFLLGMKYKLPLSRLGQMSINGNAIKCIDAMLPKIENERLFIRFHHLRNIEVNKCSSVLFNCWCLHSLRRVR